MGEVYRARDGKLNRDVALKILPEAFATDPDRLARFRREAQVLASLSHPNIGHIYGFEDSGATHALVLELIEGPTLADRIAHGPIPLSEAVPIVRQIAGALETAHEQGIIHRDLKPANIKVRPDGTVKVLDFGLAKAMEPTGVASPSVSQSPTIPAPAMTQTGMILGTAAYMSPEQARGNVVDKRTDIWAFGCVLFEMLTGRLAFKGDTVSDTIVAILSGEPEWGALPAATPASVRGLLQRCLEKDPKLRLRDLGDARIELDQLDRRSGQVEAAPPGIPSTPSARPRRVMYLALGVVLLVLAGAAGVFYATRPRVPVTTSSEYIQLTNFADSAVAPSLSPDGRMLTFKRGEDAFLSSGQIYVKTLPNGEPIRLTNDTNSKYAPMFTPDSSRITYTSVNTSGTVSFDTWTVRVSGGPPTQLLPNASGLTWIPGQRLLFAEVTGPGSHMGIVTATESRAERRLIYSPSHHAGMAHYASLSPNGQSVLVVEMDQTHAFDRPCRLLPFDGSSAGGQVGPRGTCTSAAWSPDGTWMYFSVAVGGSSHIWRQKFPNGAPEQITFGPGEQEDVALGPDGTWLVTSVGTRRSAIWLHDATGERAILSEGYAVAPRLSRSGTRMFYLSARDLGLSAGGGWAASSAELRVLDLASGNPDSVLPAMSVTDYDISSDETEVAFTRHERDGGPEIWLAPLDRRTPPRRVAEKGDRVSFGADGYLVFRSVEEDTKLVRIKKEGGIREPVTTVPVFDKFAVSPDGQWVIVLSSGARTDAVHGTLAVSLRGGAPRKICEAGCVARWSSDGRFFYVRVGRSTSAQGRTIAIPVPAGQSLPYFPASGISSAADAMKLAGARVIDQENVFPGLTPTTYLFQKVELQRNLFRIPLH